MRLRPTPARALGLLVAASVMPLAACGPGAKTASSSTAPASSLERSTTRGGVLSALSLGPVLAWDPQRIGSQQDMAFAGRVFERTLTAYTPVAPGRQTTLAGDLATDTGTPSADLKTWTFTLRDGSSWQDGSPVTCADVRYGISRTFATTEITGGPTYALAYLDVPKNANGSSTYLGPYTKGPTATAGQVAFDKAVSCVGQTITFHLSAPTSDFNETLSLPAFGPYEQSTDRGGSGAYAVSSNGPYQLKAPWQPSSGGTWVRNPKWSAASDPLRQAYVDEIVYQEGQETQTVAQRIMADGADGRGSVSLGSAPPAMQQQIMAAADLRNRVVNPTSGIVDYLAPNLKSAVFANPYARQALAAATNRDAYVTALGGQTTAKATFSIIPSSLAAYDGQDTVGAGTKGDPAKAAALLAKAHLKAPVPIRVAYRSTPTSDKAMAALLAGWTQAGFAPVLQPIASGYFDAISAPAIATEADVFWANWAPDWPSASTVLPPVFDSRLNLSAAGPGRDYGYFADAKIDARMTSIESIADPGIREKAWGALDVDLRTAGAYIGLAQRKNLYIAGSTVRNFSTNEASGGFVEFADISLK